MKLPQKPIDYNALLVKHSQVIFKLLGDPEISKVIYELNKEHLHWDELKYKKMPKDANPEHIWALMKVLRNSQYRRFKFLNWNLKYVLLDEFQMKLHLLDKETAGRLGASYDSEGNVFSQKYIISSLMEEAIASSQLEGAATTRKLAKEMLITNKKPHTYSEKMILNGYRTIQKVAKMKDCQITPDIILALHKDITEDTLKDKRYEGVFRDNNEVVVGDPVNVETIYHQPPDYKEISKMIDDFCKFANNDDKDFIHPIIKGIILHFLIGYIHPFEDGNGRTARALFYWYVLHKGYWLFEFMAISRIILRSKKRYGLSYLYTENDENDLTYFIDYQLCCIEEALHDMEKYISRKQKEQHEAMMLIKKIKEINLRQAEILKEFMKNQDKFYVLKEIIGIYGVAYDTARNDLLYLTKLGYLEKIKVQKKFMFKLSDKKQIQF